MNRWKVAFFLLLLIIILGFVWLVTNLVSPTESESLPIRSEQADGGELLVETSKADFELLANKYLQEAVKDQAIPLDLQVNDKIALVSELQVFSLTIPVQMFFDPVVLEDGNIQLKQNQVDVGQLSIPPEQVLKLLRDSVKLPSWMVVSPEDESLFIDLSGIPIEGGFDIRAKQIDLEQDEIVFSVIVPTN